MRRIASLAAAIAIAAGVLASTAAKSGQAENGTAPIFGVTIPPDYRDWHLISVVQEEGDFNQLRAQLGNDIAMKATRGDPSVPRRRNYRRAALEARSVG
jgi:hypothetical protein